MGKGLSGDFIGFTFNGIHSSTLGIARISNGSRYIEDLLPTYQDKVVEAPGADETFYFGSYYKQKVININFAFDNLTETQIRILKQTFGDKEIHELWFDETPYKAYNVKVSGNPQLKYICFNIQESKFQFKRVYKGEGTVSFIAYYPFAHSRYNYIDDFDQSYGNSNEWTVASKLRIRSNYGKILNVTKNERKILLWNAGDISTDFKLNIRFGNATSLTAGTISIDRDKKLALRSIPKLGADDGIQINTRLKIIQGYQIDSKGKKTLTSNVYNQYIAEGDFFKMPLEDSELKILGLFGSHRELVDIEYQHWYL